MAVDVSLWSSDAWTSAADTYLLARTREGSDEAFAELWRRNLPAAYAVANRYRGHQPAEDVVAEAATRVLALIKEGRGPEENFRAYFLSAVRSVAVDAGRRDLRLVPTPDEDLDGLIDPVVHDVEADGFDPDIVRAAFRELSERDQRILWHTTVEGEAPRVVGPTLGMSANAVSVRAMRAREALRARYLEAYAASHRSGATTPECHWALGVLGQQVRGRLPKRAADRLEEHLDGCAHESALLAELRTIQDRFPALVVPLLFAAGATTPGFLGGAALAGLGGAAGAAGAGAAEPLVGAEGAAAVSVPEPDGAGSLASELGLESGLESGAAVGAAEAGGVQPQSSGGADAASSLAARAAGLAAAAIVAVGALTGGPTRVAEVATGSAVSSASSSSSTTSSATSGTSTTSSTTSATTAATTSATITTAVPTTTVVPPATAVAAAPPPPAPAPAAPRTTVRPPAPTRPGPGIELRVISSGTPTRFSIRFSTDISGTLQVSVANASGTGRLSAQNGAYACDNASPSSVACSGREGHILLEQSGLPMPGPVVVRVTDSAGGTTTQTLRLR